MARCRGKLQLKWILKTKSHSTVSWTQTPGKCATGQTVGGAIEITVVFVFKSSKHKDNWLVIILCQQIRLQITIYLMWSLRHCWDKTLLTATRNTTDMLRTETQNSSAILERRIDETFSVRFNETFHFSYCLASTSHSQWTTVTAHEMDDSDNTMLSSRLNSLADSNVIIRQLLTGSCWCYFFYFSMYFRLTQYVWLP